MRHPPCWDLLSARQILSEKHTLCKINKYTLLCIVHTLEYLITVHKRSHSIYMLSSQIDTKTGHLPSVQQHQIVLLCKPYEIEFSTMYVFKMLYGYQILQSRYYTVMFPEFQMMPFSCMSFIDVQNKMGNLQKHVKNLFHCQLSCDTFSRPFFGQIFLGGAAAPGLEAQ